MADDPTAVNAEIPSTAAEAGDDQQRQDPRQGRGRGGAPRDAGGFRIRLSDNELRAARALQDAFGLRSTVAVLGFSLRTLAQQLEDGQLEALIAEQRSQRGAGGGRPGGERRRERGDARPAPASRGPRVDPFARPARPAAVVESAPAEVDAAPAEVDAALADVVAAPAEAAAEEA